MTCPDFILWFRCHTQTYFLWCIIVSNATIIKNVRLVLNSISYQKRALVTSFDHCPFRPFHPDVKTKHFSWWLQYLHWLLSWGDIYRGTRLTLKCFFSPRLLQKLYQMPLHLIALLQTVASCRALQCPQRPWMYWTDCRGSRSFPSSHRARHSLWAHTYHTVQQRRSFTLLTSIQVRNMAAGTCITISKDKKPRVSASLYSSAEAAHHITNELAVVCLIVILRILQRT